MNLVAAVVVAVLIQYFYFGILVGRARSRAGIAAPAVTGDPVFERTLRVQQNTLEQLVIFLPCIGLFAHYVSPGLAAMLGLVFLLGRALYAAGYINEAGKRGPGFMITIVAQGILALGALFGALGAAF
ncbi:MAG: MAPEG family protein [Myxococcales bacterium]|nr:MAPEG family protein [Myxococcales bacterium]